MIIKNKILFITLFYAKKIVDKNIKIILKKWEQLNYSINRQSDGKCDMVL